MIVFFVSKLQTSSHGDEAKSLAPQPVVDDGGVQNFSKVSEEQREVGFSESEGDVADVESQWGGGFSRYHHHGLTNTMAISLDLDIRGVHLALRLEMSKVSLLSHLGLVGWS